MNFCYLSIFWNKVEQDSCDWKSGYSVTVPGTTDLMSPAHSLTCFQGLLFPECIFSFPNTLQYRKLTCFTIDKKLNLLTSWWTLLPPNSSTNHRSKNIPASYLSGTPTTEMPKVFSILFQKASTALRNLLYISKNTHKILFTILSFLYNQNNLLDSQALICTYTKFSEH